MVAADDDSQPVLVGKKLSGLTLVPWSTVTDGQIQPVLGIKNDRIRLLVLCDNDGKDLTLSLRDFAERLPESASKNLQVCVLFAASQQEVSDVLGKPIPRDSRTFGDLFSGALLATGGNRQLLGQSVLRASGVLPGFEAASFKQASAPDRFTPAILIGKSGFVEWVGDLKWSDRPMRQLIAGTWDRTVTELASRLSHTLFFEMRFYVEAGGTLEKLREQFGTDEQGPFALTNGTVIQRQFVGGFLESLDYVPDLNVAKPLLFSIEAESKGERQSALDNLLESLLAVNLRVITRDQYWWGRPVGGFLKSLQEIIRINQQVANLVDDTGKQKLSVQQQSLGQLIALLETVQAGDFQQVNSLIEAFSVEEQRKNQFGFLRCQVDAYVNSGSSDAGILLNQLLAQLPKQTKFTPSFSRLRSYSQSAITKKLLAGDSCSEEIRAIAKDAFRPNIPAPNLKAAAAWQPDVVTITNP